MSDEIARNTEEHYKTLGSVKSYCYLNKATGQYLWLAKIIERTTNVSHLVRIKELDHEVC